MKKKKLLFLVLVISIVTSITFILDAFNASSDLINVTFKNKIFVWILTIILLVYYRRSNSNPQLVPSVLSSDKMSNKEKSKPDVSFKDVAGLEEIKDELQETIDFINNSSKYTKMGAHIPKGILFYGPPGTGKTLLAKAVAGETNSNFHYASGSEFVEKYVGVGAKRVRTLFEKAKKDTPSIIFIDEIDAIGTKRNLESNNEKDQTLNQLLVEMDGFNTDDTVVVIGATNRLDLLDEALLRPGRFDRHIYIGNPNMNARQQILEVHTRNKPLDKSMNIKDIAKKTHGLSGAELANIANEAAIIAVRNKETKLTLKHFDLAIERVVAGLEVKNPTVLLKEKKTVSIHEAGHAIVCKILNVDMVQKISIVPRGHALGYVLKFPEEDRYLLSEQELMNKISGLLAGRAAENLVFKEVTTGAKDDLDKATNIAREMVCAYGMSGLGLMAVDEHYIKYNYDIVRNEIKQILDKGYQRATKIIKENHELLHHISNVLMEKETIDSDELKRIFDLYETPIDCAT
ncbi:AAA family ATPase [Schnuerera sp. xch1]|uniref:ATP-dependent metallopeptidase FtsH/Yme1/Tma family protein n=1 Tax=Schnuerera sp. xch1 TaxID=2874283 RepID=UPI001CBE6364|nr:AAA family ATPase [Schnuerera sp. xch1]MBZ2175939.1 AAA family ATPase [Schnuerera sp. xch1]